MSSGFSIVVLTYNEEKHLGECLKNCLRYTPDVHVLDSFSADGTVAIASDLATSVSQNVFTGFGDQRNHAIETIETAYPWTLHLDADERLTDVFVDELRETVRRNPSEAGFYVPNKLMFAGRWLKYTSGYPYYQLRFFHRERMRFANQGHGQLELPIDGGRIGTISEPYLHFSFQNGLAHWFSKHAGYAVREAASADAATSTGKALIDLIRGTALQRQRALKVLSRRMPLRRWLRLAHTLIWNRGILDGRAGITYARMLATYDEMYTLAREARRLEEDGN